MENTSVLSDFTTSAMTNSTNHIALFPLTIGTLHTNISVFIHTNCPLIKLSLSQKRHIIPTFPTPYNYPEFF